MERCFSCSPFYAFFLPEKESVGKKSRHKGDCAAIRYAPIRRSFPLMYPLFDCPADSETKGSYPKRSAGIMPRVSKNEYHVLSLSFPHPQSALRCMSTALVFHVRGVCCDARLLPQFFALAERAAMPVCCFVFSCSPSVYRRKAEPQQSQVTAKTSHAKSNRRKTIRSDIYNGGTPGQAAADPGVLLLLGGEALEYHSAANA